VRSTPSLTISLTLSLKRFQCSSDWRWLSLVLSRKIVDGSLSSFQGRSSSASSFQAPRLQAISGVVSLAMCPQVVSQAPQHFGSSETQTTCCSCFSCLLVYRSFISLEAGMARAVHPKEFLKVDVKHWRICQSGIPIPFPPLFGSKLIESVWMMACVVWLSKERLHCFAGLKSVVFCFTNRLTRYQIESLTSGQGHLKKEEKKEKEKRMKKREKRKKKKRERERKD